MNKTAYVVVVFALVFTACASGNTVRKEEEFVSAQTLPAPLIKSLKKDRQIKEDMAICKVMEVEASSFMPIRKTGNYCVTDRAGKKSLWIKKTYVEELIRKSERKKQRRKKRQHKKQRKAPATPATPALPATPPPATPEPSNTPPSTPLVPVVPTTPVQPSATPPATTIPPATTPPAKPDTPARPAPPAKPDQSAPPPPAKPAPTSTEPKTPV